MIPEDNHPETIRGVIVPVIKITHIYDPRNTLQA